VSLLHAAARHPDALLILAALAAAIITAVRWALSLVPPDDTHQARSSW